MISEQKCSIVGFPRNGETVIRLTVDVFLETGQESRRDWMLQTIRNEMAALDTTHIDCGNFEVFHVADDRTDDPTGLILFDTKNLVLGKNCPGCGRNYFKTKILTVYEGWKHERHVYGCKCGEVFTITWKKGGYECIVGLLI